MLLRNLTRINGSTGPPQDVRLYIPRAFVSPPGIRDEPKSHEHGIAYLYSTGESLPFGSAEKKSWLANATPLRVSSTWRAYHGNLKRLGGPERHAQGEKPEKGPHAGDGSRRSAEATGSRR